MIACRLLLTGLLLSPSWLAADELLVDQGQFDRFAADPLEVFRISQLALRDPHIHILVEPGFPLPPLCLDVTESSLPGVPSFNGLIDDSLNQDSNDDGFLDNSPLILLQPRGWPEPRGRLALATGRCTAPASSTSCTVLGSAPFQAVQNREIGLCRAALAGTVRPYVPPVPTIDGPCFATHPSSTSLDLAGLGLALTQATISAGWSAVDDGVLAPGLLRGFVPEATADTLILPAELPLIGGQPLSALLPGGQGNCANHSDLDELDGVSGWWFYFEMAAELPPGSR